MMKLSPRWILVLFFASICGGQQLPRSDQEAIEQIFGKPPAANADSPNVNGDEDMFTMPGYELVPEKKDDGFGALEKCGEGETAGVKKCVPYYLCDRKTNTIIQNGRTDGFGVIDIRFGANSCDHPLDVCCNLPKDNGVEMPPPDNTSNEPPSVRPPIDESTPPTRPSEPPKCGKRNKNGIDFKMTGNNHNEAEYGEFPWMVAIIKKNSVETTFADCGGSLVAPNVVLTGAHCVYNVKADEVRVRAGEWDTQTDKERLPYQERDIASIIIHNHFNPQTLFNDIALLVLKESLQLDEHIATVCLPLYNEPIQSENCFASGWGKDVFGKKGQFQMILKKIEMPLVRHGKCQNALRTTRLGKHFKLHPTFVCAGGKKGVDTCTGDGGSPLVCPDPRNPSRYIQAGIVAWGIGCGEQNVPGVYGDTTKFRLWVDDEFRNLQISTDYYTV